MKPILIVLLIALSACRPTPATHCEKWTAQVDGFGRPHAVCARWITVQEVPRG